MCYLKHREFKQMEYFHSVTNGKRQIVSRRYQQFSWHIFHIFIFFIHFSGIFCVFFFFVDVQQVRNLQGNIEKNPSNTFITSYRSIS